MGHLGVYGKMILKRILRKFQAYMRMRTRFMYIILGNGQIAVSSKHYNKASISEKGGKFLNNKTVPDGGASSYSFSASALDVFSGQRALAQGKGPPVPIVQKTGWAPEPVWTQRLKEKILPPLLGIETRSPGRPASSQTLY
jgi:hypothetical protein